MAALLRPEDDGAAAALPGRSLPPLALPATDGRTIDLGRQSGWWVLYCYTMTGQPGVPLPPDWDSTPGAHGSTPQSEAFRDLHPEFSVLGVAVYGLSSQTTVWQQEAAARLRLPFALLSDHRLQLQSALGLPTFQAGSADVFYRRLTLVLHGERIVRVFYPVFPPAENAAEVLAWLRAPGRLES